jgi:hypothetical protein
MNDCRSCLGAMVASIPAGLVFAGPILAIRAVSEVWRIEAAKDFGSMRRELRHHTFSAVKSRAPLSRRLPPLAGSRMSAYTFCSEAAPS